MTDKILIDRIVIEQVLEDICGAKLCEINSMSSRHEMLRLMEKSASALRAALEQPQVEQEPVAEITGMDEYGPMLGWHKHWAEFPVGTKLYTHPQNLNCKSTQHRLATLWGYEKPQLFRQPLTDEQIETIWDDWYRSWTGLDQFETIIRMVEKHHGIV